jgi:hypothetical protein
MARPKPGWHPGKVNSPHFEELDLIVFAHLRNALERGDSPDAIVNYFREGRHYHEKPLGSHFLKRVAVIDDLLTLVLTVHLFLERFLDAIVTKKFPNARVILKNRAFTFALKADLLRAKNYLREDVYNDVRLINAIRNKFAHDLMFDLADFDMSKFWYCEQWSDLSFENINQRRAAASFLFRCLAESLLYRMTHQHRYLGDIEAPATLVSREP